MTVSDYHTGQHSDCFACKIKSVQIAPSATPSRNRGREAAGKKKAEKQLVQDLGAFKRMRESGLTPRAVDGAADLEKRAQVPYEIVSGQLAKDMAKGADVGRGGKEWARRAQDAHESIQRGEQVES